MAKEFVGEPNGGEIGKTTRSRGNTLPPLLGVIKVIHAASMGTLVARIKGVLTMVPEESHQEEQPLGKRMKCVQEPIIFNDEDLEGTS